MNDLDSTTTDKIADKDQILAKIRLENTERRRQISLRVCALKVASLIPLTELPDRSSCRWATNALCFEPAPHGGVLIIATNRQSIAIRHDPDGTITTPDNKPLLISPRADQTKALHPVFAGLQNPKPYSSPQLVAKDDSITQEGGRPGTYALEPLLVTDGGTFPKWPGIIKPFLKTQPYQAGAAFPANILARFDFHPKAKPNEAHAVLLWQEPRVNPTEPNFSPIFVTSPYPDSADMIGAFMPVHNKCFTEPTALDLVTPQRHWITHVHSSDHELPAPADSNGKLAA